MNILKSFIFFLTLGITFIFIAIFKVNASYEPCVVLPDGSVYCGTNPPDVTINLNEKKNVSLSSGQTKSYYITLAQQKYYIVETFGNYDTYLIIKDLSEGTLLDDDSGVGLNAAIGFIGEYKTIKISTRFAYTSMSGTYQLQIREQQAVLYGFDYSINTIPSLNSPNNYLENMYKTYKFTDKDATHILSKDERDIRRLNSEIVFFSGLGYVNGTGIAFSSDSLLVNQISGMDNVKSAMCSASYTGISIANKSVNEGAQAAVGFNKSVSVASTKTFTDRFFQKLAEGGTIKQAASFGELGILWPFDNVADYKIAGDKYLIISTPEISISSLPILTDNLLNEFNTKLAEASYTPYQITEEVIRYYKTVNGLLTNDFYDVHYDRDNNINHIEHSGFITKTEKVLPKNITNTKTAKIIAENGILYNKLIDEESHYVYYLINNELVPIEIKYCTYKSETGVVTVYVDCTNLYNGEKINYEEICGE